MKTISYVKSPEINRLQDATFVNYLGPFARTSNLLKEREGEGERYSFCEMYLCEWQKIKGIENAVNLITRERERQIIASI